MITDMDLVMAVVVVVAAVATAAMLGYIAGRTARVRALRRRLLAAEEALERDTGGLEDVMRAVTHRQRGRAR